MPKWLNACPASDPAIRRVDSLRKQLAARLDDVALRVEIARHYFDLAMVQGDPRYLGYASAALAPLAKTNPDNADYAMVRGLIQQFSHEFEPALASLTKASELNPTSADPLLWRSAIYMVQALIFSTESAEQTLALQPSSAWQTFSQHVVEGVWHIWTGFDHIFLLALLLPAVVTRQAGQ